MFGVSIFLTVNETAWSLPMSSNGVVAPMPTQSPADEAHARGVIELGQNNLNGAEAAFKESAKLDPKLAAPLLGLADVALKRSQPKDAESWLAKALDVAPNDPAVHTSWGRYYSARKQFQKSEVSFKKAIALDPKAFAPRVDLADLYMNGFSQPKEASEAYRAALTVQPDHAGAHHGLGMALAAAGQAVQAIPEFEKAASLAPTNPLPLQALGRLYFARHDYDKALDAYNRALKIQPDFLIAHVGRGDVFAAKGDANQAIAEYLAAIHAAPKYSEAHLKLGMTYQQQKRWEEAEAAYLKAVESDPNSGLAWNNLAWMAAERKKRLDDALAWAKKAVATSPGNVDFQDTLGWVYRARGEADKAASVLTPASKAKPPRAEVFYHLGIVYAELGRGADAVTAFKRALQVDGGFPGAKDANARMEALAR
jgi:tetratricopeptide (TPR) repeat protein